MTRFERFEAAEKARPRGDAARENDARALERQADYLRTMGLPREDAIADDLDREAKAIREHNGRVMGERRSKAA